MNRTSHNFCCVHISDALSQLSALSSIVFSGYMSTTAARSHCNIQHVIRYQTLSNRTNKYGWHEHHYHLPVVSTRHVIPGSWLSLRHFQLLERVVLNIEPVAPVCVFFTCFSIHLWSVQQYIQSAQPPPIYDTHIQHNQPRWLPSNASFYPRELLWIQAVWELFLKFKSHIGRTLFLFFIWKKQKSTEATAESALQLG